MAVLSDVSIRNLIESKQLIVDGDPASAKHCAYEFKAARVVYGGIVPPSLQVSAIDLCSKPSQTAVIPPSGVAWVRTRERVKIPSDLVGMWVQTNSLSRRGLLLLNSTLVEPGYDGHLSAHFVNLGSAPVLLSLETTIAKLIFFKLDTDAADLIDSTKYLEYDAMIDALAAQSSRSFLRVSELASDLGKASADLVVEAKKQIDMQSKDALEKAKEELTEMKKETFLKVGGGFVVGLALAVAFSLWVFPAMRAADSESRDRISGIISERGAELNKQVKKLEEEVKDLRTSLEKGRAVLPQQPVVPQNRP